MIKFIRDNPKLTILVVLVVVLFILVSTNHIEGFSTCYCNKKVYLNAVNKGEGEGIAILEQNRGKLHVSLQANLPYHNGGLYHTVLGGYKAYLVDHNHPMAETVYLGDLLRYGDRIYRLKNELAGDYSAYTHVQIIRHNKKYGTTLVLEGPIH